MSVRELKRRRKELYAELKDVKEKLRAQKQEAYIKKAMLAANGSVTKAAKTIGYSRKYMTKLVRLYGLPIDQRRRVRGNWGALCDKYGRDIETQPHA